MNFPLTIVSTFGVVSVLPVLRRARRACRGTTLTTAWIWALAWWASCLIAMVVTIVPIDPAVHDQVAYLAMILGLCPPIAVLGAKRPGSRVWAFFVLAPLLLVFAWPAVVCWVSPEPPDRLQLETPMVVAACLVVVMGYGNYLGTKQLLTAVLLGGAVGWLAVLFSQAPLDDIPRPIAFPLLLATAGVWWGMLVAGEPTRQAGWNRVWQEFQSLFGLVWAKRILERVNFTAEKEQWNARLDSFGFLWDENANSESKRTTEDRIDHTLRWLLRRFVDPEWLDERLQGTSNDDANNVNGSA